MARPKVAHASADAILALVDGDGRLAVRVTPGARSETVEIVGGRLLAKVRAAPENGKATAGVLALLAEALDIAPSRLRLLRGATSREKLFVIDG